MFTQADQSFAVGGSLKGTWWGREMDTCGLSLILDGLSSEQSTYLSKGGVGFIIGDGALKLWPRNSRRSLLFLPSHQVGVSNRRLPVRRESGLQPRSWSCLHIRGSSPCGIVKKERPAARYHLLISGSTFVIPFPNQQLLRFHPNRKRVRL